MQFTKEEVLQAESISAIKSERVATRRLVLAAGNNPFFDIYKYSENLRQELEKLHKVEIIVETSAVMVDSIAAFRKLLRLIPRFESSQLFYDGTKSFLKSIVPAILISRFFGKGVSLFYYPDQIINAIPRAHIKGMSWCNRVYVGTRYLQRELAEYQVRSEVMLPPVDLNSFPARTISEIQPHILLVHESAVDAGAICAMRAFIMVKHKYPRTTMTVVTSDAIRWQIGVMQLGQNIQGHYYCNPNEQEKIKSAFAIADVFVNCSPSETVTSPLLAAMVSGLPSISF